VEVFLCSNCVSFLGLSLGYLIFELIGCCFGFSRVMSHDTC
jgi:hypothetical protein